MKKKIILTIISLVVLIALVIILIKVNFNNSSKNSVSEEITKCIGNNSVLYVQLGCSHCINQKNMFGENVKFLNITDCFYETEKCSDIAAVPTWKINNQYYKGVQSIETLKELTGCKF
jgi:hypothetical protein